MPPAPSGLRTSYEPRRAPGDMGTDYSCQLLKLMGKDYTRGEGKAIGNRRLPQLSPSAEFGRGGQVRVQAASPHESQLVEEALGNSFLDELPARLIGDKAYDSDPLDRQMEEEYGIEMIAPHRRDRRHPTQDGRPLRRYRRRWTVERFFAWLQWFRRLVTRWEHHIENFFGMVRLGCMKIMPRYF